MIFIDNWDWYIYKGNIYCTTGYMDKTKKSSLYAEARTKNALERNPDSQS